MDPTGRARTGNRETRPTRVEETDPAWAGAPDHRIVPPAVASQAFRQLLDATVRHLESLQEQGVTQVAVDPRELRQLMEARPAMPPRPRTPKPTPAPPTGSPPTAPRARAGSVPAHSGGAPAKTDPAPRLEALTQLQTRALACTRCPHLVRSRTQVVFGVGHPDAEIMFIGEAPGADEDLQGEPFVGRAGQLLTKIIEAMALSRDQVYIANILKCRPDTPGQTAGNRRPREEEMATCIPYLHEQIDLVQPRVLVALGATAFEGLLGKPPAGSGISRARGAWHAYRGIPLMPTYHPAYLLRNQNLTEKRKVWEDMLQVLEHLGHPVSAKQRRFFQKAA